MGGEDALWIEGDDERGWSLMQGDTEIEWYSDYRAALDALGVRAALAPLGGE